MPIALLFAAALVSPSPEPSVAPPTPAPAGIFSTSGLVRLYEFQKINAVGTNQRALNIGGALHAEYTRNAHPFTLGATYYAAEPFGLNGPNPQSNTGLDNTLPAYRYSALGELYAQYRTWRDFIQLGKMQIASPWANAADGRLIPVTYQGVVGRHYFESGWDIGITRIARFKSRTSSTFDANNLLTNATTPGFLLVELTRSAGTISGSVHQYWFYDIASMTYAQVRVRLSDRAFTAAQAVAESDIGRALLGTIHNHTLGLQLGTRIGVVNATLGYDTAPRVTYITTAPQTIFAQSAVAGSSTVRALGGGRFAVAGGGIASPYTDGYVADPLFTTAIAASLVDRRSAGYAFKFTLTAQSGNGRFSGTLARGFYNYSNSLSSATATETDADGTYFLSNIDPARVYSGFSIRQRWGYRTTTGAPLRFLYSRTQLQYDF